MARRLSTNIITLLAIIAVIMATGWAVHRYHRPGQLDLLTAQAMDMSGMRPPVGAAPVALMSVRRGSLADTVTYTGTVQAYNVQDITPRITGQVVALPVYPGDTVHAGQVVARLDASQVGPLAAQASAQARAAGIGARVASQVQVQSKQAAQLQAQADLAAAQQAIPDAAAQVQAAQDNVRAAQAGVQSAQANTAYWKTEIAREKTLADAGAVSQQEYQDELAHAQTADAALDQARSQVRQAQAMARSDQAKETQARRQVAASAAAVHVAQANIAVAQGQAAQAAADAAAARAAQQASAAQSGYAVITSPANGVVTGRPIAPGTLVQPGTTLLQISEIDQVRVQANVAVEDLAGIHVGSPVQIAVQGNAAHPLQAHVTAVFPAANAQTRTAVVEAVVPNPGHRLLPGAFVTMQINKNTVSNTLLVPASAVVYQGGQAYVWTAGGPEAAASSGVQYKAHCGLVYSAAFAKAHHYVCPMDHLPLTPMPTGVSGPAGASGLTAHEVAVTTGASDGVWTEVASGPLATGARVVTHGQAGLTDGARVVATAWGPNGPKTLPTAAVADAGQTLYRCVKCGLTFSAADAKKDHYIDPMDGGTLMPVKGQ